MNRIRGLGALAAVARLLTGVPWMLARYGDWPIQKLPDAEWFRRLSPSYGHSPSNSRSARKSPTPTSRVRRHRRAWRPPRSIQGGR